MTVTKVDLLDAKLTKSLFGYKPAEVESVLSEAADALGRAAEENRRLAEKVRDMEIALQSMESREETLRQTLAATQKVVEDLKDNARREASLIVDEARAKAAEFIREAHQSLAEVNREFLDLRHRRVEFEMAFRALLESHLRYLDMVEGGTEVAPLAQTLSLDAGDASPDGEAETAGPDDRD